MVVHSFVRTPSIFKRPTLVLAYAVAGAVTCSGAHAADELGSASAALSHVQFTLASLAPQSGLSPSIRFGQPWIDGSVIPQQGWAAASGQATLGADGTPASPYARDAYFDAPLPTQPLQLASTDGVSSVTVQQTGMSASVTLPQDVASRMAASANAFSTTSAATVGSPLRDPGMDIDWATGHITMWPGSGPAQAVDFTLSAHTALTLSADASAVLNVGQGATSLFSDGSYLTAGAAMSLGRSVALRPLQDGYDSWFDYVSDLHAAYAWQTDGVSVSYSLGSEMAQSDGRQVTLTLVNDSDQEMAGLFMLNVGSYASLALPDGTGVVPEPATYLMMGLGLVGLAWGRRKAIASA